MITYYTQASQIKSTFQQQQFIRKLLNLAQLCPGFIMRNNSDYRIVQFYLDRSIEAAMNLDSIPPRFRVQTQHLSQMPRHGVSIPVGGLGAAQPINSQAHLHAGPTMRPSLTGDGADLNGKRFCIPNLQNSQRQAYDRGFETARQFGSPGTNQNRNNSFHGFQSASTPVKTERASCNPGISQYAKYPSYVLESSSLKKQEAIQDGQEYLIRNKSFHVPLRETDPVPNQQVQQKNQMWSLTQRFTSTKKPNPEAKMEDYQAKADQIINRIIAEKTAEVQKQKQLLSQKIAALKLKREAKKIELENREKELSTIQKDHREFSVKYAKMCQDSDACKLRQKELTEKIQFLRMEFEDTKKQNRSSFDDLLKQQITESKKATAAKQREVDMLKQMIAQQQAKIHETITANQLETARLREEQSRLQQLHAAEISLNQEKIRSLKTEACSMQSLLERIVTKTKLKNEFFQNGLSASLQPTSEQILGRLLADYQSQMLSSSPTAGNRNQENNN